MLHNIIISNKTVWKKWRTAIGLQENKTKLLGLTAGGRAGPAVAVAQDMAHQVQLLQLYWRKHLHSQLLLCLFWNKNLFASSQIILKNKAVFVKGFEYICIYILNVYIMIIYVYIFMYITMSWLFLFYIAHLPNFILPTYLYYPMIEDLVKIIFNFILKAKIRMLEHDFSCLE